MDVFEKVQELIVNKALFSAIVNCVEAGKISQSDPADTVKAIVYSAIKDNMDNIYVQFTYTDSLLKATKMLSQQKMYHEAVIMAMTYIEHSLNYFYGEYFERKVQMSNAKIHDLLKANSTSDKIGALYLLT